VHPAVSTCNKDRDGWMPGVYKEGVTRHERTENRAKQIVLRL
jgi:hypothetical protein